jgi:hypothetical protein
MDDDLWMRHLFPGTHLQLAVLKPTPPCRGPRDDSDTGWTTEIGPEAELPPHPALLTL